jgi:hypothetical protein
VHGVYDLSAGGFSNLELTDGKGAETLTFGAPVAGEVRQRPEGRPDQALVRRGVTPPIRLIILRKPREAVEGTRKTFDSTVNL